MEARKEVARTSAAFGTSSNPADGATARLTFGTISKRPLELSERLTTCSNSRYRFSIAWTTRGSKLVPLSETTCFMASSGDIARRYGRSDVRASKQSTTDRILAPIGIASPVSPCGYPFPFHLDRKSVVY